MWPAFSLWGDVNPTAGEAQKVTVRMDGRMWRKKKRRRERDEEKMKGDARGARAVNLEGAVT